MFVSFALLHIVSARLGEVNSCLRTHRELFIYFTKLILVPRLKSVPAHFLEYMAQHTGDPPIVGWHRLLKSSRIDLHPKTVNGCGKTHTESRYEGRTHLGTQTQGELLRIRLHRRRLYLVCAASSQWNRTRCLTCSLSSLVLIQPYPTTYRWIIKTFSRLRPYRNRCALCAVCCHSRCVA